MSALYELGHMVFGYLTVRFFDWKLGVRTPTWIALVAGMVPDADLYFGWAGLQHHTYTHSLLLWLPLLPVVVYWRKLLPGYLGILQHFLLGDVLVGSIPIFLPLSTLQIGLNLRSASTADAILEVGGLLVAVVAAYQIGDLRQLLTVDVRSALSVVPLLFMCSLTLIASTERNVELVEFATSRTSLEMIGIGHIILATVLTISTLQGVRGIFRNPAQELTISTIANQSSS